MPPKLIIPVLEAWTDLYNSLHSSPYFYCQIFENKGSAVGCSNPHPHCQVWTTSHIPHDPLQEFHSFLQYQQTHHSCMLCDYAELEIQKKERIVCQKGIWVAVCPYWAIWPFEVLLLPIRHVPSLPDLSKQEIADLAEILSSVTTRYDNLFKCSFPYSMGIHQAPLRIPDGEPFTKDLSHMHFHFYPILLRSATVRKFLAGYESPFQFTITIVLKCYVSHNVISHPRAQQIDFVF
jgi:UDPglucose--hexose-1-phosphate uridylyltransferase